MEHKHSSYQSCNSYAVYKKLIYIFFSQTDPFSNKTTENLPASSLPLPCTHSITVTNYHPITTRHQSHTKNKTPHTTTVYNKIPAHIQVTQVIVRTSSHLAALVAGCCGLSLSGSSNGSTGQSAQRVTVHVTRCWLRVRLISVSTGRCCRVLGGFSSSSVCGSALRRFSCCCRRSVI